MGKTKKTPSVEDPQETNPVPTDDANAISAPTDNQKPLGDDGLPHFELVDGQVMVRAKNPQKDDLPNIMHTRNVQVFSDRMLRLSVSDKYPANDKAEKYTKALARMAELKPNDAIEYELCTSIIETDNATREAMDIGLHRDNESSVRRDWLRVASTLTRTKMALIDSLRKYRTGGEQIIKHVHVNDGGQAAFIETYNQTGGEN